MKPLWGLRDVTFDGNLIHHSTHTGIYARGYDHYIGYNVIHDVCSFNKDAGAIYVWEEPKGDSPPLRAD